MIDPVARQNLATDARRLVAGRMTNDEFDDVYYEQFEPSSDAAVHTIGEFCYCRYSSDLLLPYRLKGRYAVDPETKRTVARCILFLRSQREYQWPETPNCRLARVLWSLGFYSLLCGGVLLAIALPGLLSGDDFRFWFRLTCIAATLTGFGLWAVLKRGLYSTLIEPRWKEWQAAGDYDVWPFLDREDFSRARRECHSLGTGASPSAVQRI